MKSRISVFLVLGVLCTQPLADNRSDQLNPNNDAYWESRGYDERPGNWDSSYGDDYSRNNRSNQLNPNNDAYWQSRGYDARPGDSEPYDHVDDPHYSGDGDYPVTGLYKSDFIEHSNAIETIETDSAHPPVLDPIEEATGWKIVCPSEVGSYGDCVRYRENLLSKQYPMLFSRKGKNITIHSDKQSVLFEGDGYDVNYFAIGYVRDVQLVLVLASFWSGEGFAYHLVDSHTGEYFTIHGEPEFNKSYTKLVTTHHDLVAGYNPNNIGVYSRYDHEWREEYHLSAEKWGADDPVWITDEVIRFKQISRARDSMFEIVSVDAFLVYQAGQWELVASIQNASR